MADIQFLCACGKHGTEMHDGSKNACCDLAVIVPMLEKLSVLKENGQQVFKEDILRLDVMLRDKLVALPATASAWFTSFAQPIIAALKESNVEDAEMTDEEAAAVENPEEEPTLEDELHKVFLDGYVRGYEEAFTLGYGKGFDVGSQLNLLHLSREKK